MKITFKVSLQVILFAIISLLLIMAAFSEFLPDIEQARHAIPKEVYSKKLGCNCQCIMDSRPWYSRFNYWIWLWVLVVPFLISFIKPTMRKWQKTMMIFATILTCYLSLNLSVDLAWEITNDLFRGVSSSLMGLTGGVDCYNYNDGPARGGVIFLGWIPASIYVGFWLLIRWAVYFFLKRRSKKITT